MRSVILDADSLGNDVSLNSLHHASQALTIYGHTPPEQVDQRIAGFAIVVVNKVELNEEHFVKHPQLKLIAVTATGTNNIDLEAAQKHGIAVKNVVHYGTPTIVQHVYSMILALSNHLLDYQRDVDRGAWHNSTMFCLMDHPIRELAGLKLGIVGFGELGKAVAAVAPAFGMEVLVGARPGTELGDRPHKNRLPLKQLLTEADIISLHCLLSAQTRNMIDAEALATMKKDALLINTARGGLVDEQALVAALKNYELGGAGFDVLTEEPPVNGNVLLDPQIPNLIVTPHCAWASLQARQRLVEMTAANVREFVAQQERHIPL
jgi:glycerate dehydrogenase